MALWQVATGHLALGLGTAVEMHVMEVLLVFNSMHQNSDLLLWLPSLLDPGIAVVTAQRRMHKNKTSGYSALMIVQWAPKTREKDRGTVRLFLASRGTLLPWDLKRQRRIPQAQPDHAPLAWG